MFLHLSVSHFVHRGRGVSVRETSGQRSPWTETPRTDTPPDRPPQMETPPWTETPPDRDPYRRRPPDRDDTPPPPHTHRPPCGNERVVRILLECILV